MKTVDKKGQILVNPDTSVLEDQQMLEHATTRDLLWGLLVEMKILNAQMALITNTEYKEGDV